MELSSCGRSREACLFCCDGPKKVRIFFRGGKKKVVRLRCDGNEDTAAQTVCIIWRTDESPQSAPAKSHTQPNLEQ